PPVVVPPVAGPRSAAPPVNVHGVAHYPVGKPARGANQKVAIAAVVALIAGGVIGYMVRGGGDSGGGGGGSGGGASSGALSTPILQGLASLDTYEWRASVATVGPTAGDHTEMTGSGSSDSAKQLRHMKMTNTSAAADDTDGPSTSATETWREAETSCTFDGEEYTKKATNPFESDIGTVLSGVFDIVIPKGNAKLVGSENVAGIAADHYTFTIEGLGGKSGAQVKANNGELWVAKDGRYVLRYKVTTKMVDSAQGGKEYSMTLTLEMTSVNQSVSIVMPAGCVNAPITTTG
ncbi:MAG: hypothetical protein WCK21_10840, partial [Actinomycetota bacterium]